MRYVMSAAMYDPQVYGLLGAVLLVHFGTLVYVYLRRQRSGGSATAESDVAGDGQRTDAVHRDVDRSADAPEGTVVCPACGTRNAVDYRFCRACVADLSGGAPRSGGEPFSNAA